LCNKQLNSLLLDGYIAAVLHSGGAYKNVGDPAEAKKLGVNFVASLCQDRYSDIAVFTCSQKGLNEKYEETLTKEELAEKKEQELEFPFFPSMNLVSTFFDPINCWSHAFIILDKEKRRISFLMITDRD